MPGASDGRTLEETRLDPVQARLWHMTKAEAEKTVEILDGYGIKSQALAASEELAQWRVRVSVLGIDASTSAELVDHFREAATDSMELEELCAMLSSVKSF